MQGFDGDYIISQVEKKAVGDGKKEGVVEEALLTATMEVPNAAAADGA